MPGSPRRKKTSEANGIPDPVMFNDLLHENQMLKDKIAKDEEGRKKVSYKDNYLFYDGFL